MSDLGRAMDRIERLELILERLLTAAVNADTEGIRTSCGNELEVLTHARDLRQRACTCGTRWASGPLCPVHEADHGTTIGLLGRRASE